MARSLATTSKCSSSQSHPQHHRNISRPDEARIWGAAPTEKLLPSGLRASRTRKVTRPTCEIWMTQSALSHRSRVSPDRPMALCSSGDVVLPVHENPMPRAVPDGIDETNSRPSYLCETFAHSTHTLPPQTTFIMRAQVWRSGQTIHFDDLGHCFTALHTQSVLSSLRCSSSLGWRLGGVRQELCLFFLLGGSMSNVFFVIHYRGLYRLQISDTSWGCCLFGK